MSNNTFREKNDHDETTIYRNFPRDRNLFLSEKDLVQRNYEKKKKKKGYFDVSHLEEIYIIYLTILSPKFYPNLSFVYLVENLQFFFFQTLCTSNIDDLIFTFKYL